MFIDQATIYVKAGDGGNGVISFRHEKFIPKGGPDGGNGGRGGNIVFVSDGQMSTLMDFRYKRRYLAHNGANGQGANKTGRSGEDTIIRVPVGTTLRNADTQDVLSDLITDGAEVVIARGGTGGRGNGEFATPTNQAPRKQTNGTPGEELNLQLELKLLADVGLVGFPNAGKSTLISRISAAKPKIADYPFTTLIPNLGIVRYAEEQSFVVADMPGLIEGAHAGKGLGIQFLRHIERTRVLAFLIDCTSDDPRAQYNALVKELELFNPSLLKKPRVTILTKADLADPDMRSALEKLRFTGGGRAIIISAATGEGLQPFLDAVWKKLRSKKTITR